MIVMTDKVLSVDAFILIYNQIMSKLVDVVRLKSGFGVLC